MAPRSRRPFRGDAVQRCERLLTAAYTDFVVCVMAGLLYSIFVFVREDAVPDLWHLRVRPLEGLPQDFVELCCGSTVRHVEVHPSRLDRPFVRRISALGDLRRDLVAHHVLCGL